MLENVQKIVRFEPSWKLRKTPYVLMFFQNPPKGYSFVFSAGVQNRAWNSLSKFGASFRVQRALAEIIPVQLTKSYIESFKKPRQEFDLTYALNHLVLRKESWILDMEFELPYMLCGSERMLGKFKGIVKKVLHASYLKKIIFAVELGQEAFLYEYGEELREKTVVIHRADIQKELEKNYRKEKIKILFVNSGNITDLYSFYIKGGAEVVEAVLRINRKYGERVSWVLRTVMPRNVRERLSKFSNVRLIENAIPRAELDHEWQSADIFVHPHYGNMSNAILEALSYGLPVVTTDTWATSELVEDGKTGFSSS